MEEKSLLDLLKDVLERRRVYRAVLTLAALCLFGAGMVRLIAGAGAESLISIALGVALFLAARCFRPSVEIPETRWFGAPSAIRSLASRHGISSLRSCFVALAAGSALPIAYLLAASGSWCLHERGADVWTGLLLMAAGIALFVRILPRQETERSSPASPCHDTGEDHGTPVRWKTALIAAGLSGLTFISLPENRFTLPVVLLWAFSIGAWVFAFWDVPPRSRRDWPTVFSGFLRGETVIRMTPQLPLMLGILALSALFRFGRLDAVPAEMTSQHVEDLLVVSRILNEGARPMFEPAIGGRETMAFYIAALAAHFAGTGLAHLTLKIVGATAGFVTLFFVYLLAREIAGNGMAGLLSMLAAGIAWWPNVLGRLGLSVSVGGLFAALALWLTVRAIKRRHRNSALLSGLAAGIGMHAYASMWIVPVATTLALALHGFHRRSAARIRITGRYWAASMCMTLAVLVPLLRYHIGHRQEFLARAHARIAGDAGRATNSTVSGLMDSEWNSLLMFHRTSDPSWFASPPGQPALDWFMAGLLVLGVAWLLCRFRHNRDLVDIFVPLSVPVLLLPSTLVLAFEGRENPSLLRSSAAIPVIFALVGAALLPLIDQYRRSTSPKLVKAVGAVLLATALTVTASANRRIVFRDYATNYARAAQNASGIGRVVSAFAHSVGSYDTVFLKGYPHWADVRAVGIYAGKFTWEQAICDTCRVNDPSALMDEKRAKLFIMHPLDRPFLEKLRETFPDGSLRVHGTSGSHHDFLTYFVPGQPEPTGSHVP